MKQILWKSIAWLASCHLVTKVIVTLGVIRPYFHLERPNGDAYMHRWWVRKEPKDWRIKPPLIPYAARLHHIALPDKDRDLHDHPYDYRTIVLKGWYVERTLTGRHLLCRGDTAAHQATHFHTIEAVSDGGVWTLFIYRLEKPNNKWGFLVDGQKVPWRDYVKENA